MMTEKREAFRRLVEELVTRFETEVDRREWITRRYPKRLRDGNREIYEVPALFLQKGAVSVLLDPIGYDMPGADAAADLYLMPTYDPTAGVYFEEGRWMLYRLSPQGDVEGQAEPLSAEVINQILNQIADHAVPSV